MSRFASWPRMWFNARAFSAGTSYYGGLSDFKRVKRIVKRDADLICESIDRLWGGSRDLIVRSVIIEFSAS